MHLLYGSGVIVHGDSLSESSGSLAFQTMQLLIVLQFVVILYKGLPLLLWVWGSTRVDKKRGFRAFRIEEGKERVIVGTLYKHLKPEPCSLDEYSKEKSVTLLVKPHNFMHLDDGLVVEDESGRVKLGGTMLLLVCMEKKPMLGLQDDATSVAIDSRSPEKVPAALFATTKETEESMLEILKEKEK
ncbi:hypothetical protein AAG906_017937 [Vitis piasezkii]